MTSYPNETVHTLDQVTEDVASVGCGEVWTYYFKETLIGVRDVRNAQAFFLDVSTKDDTKASMAPTIKYLTDAHVKDAVEEMSNENEKIEYLHIKELGGKATLLLMGELNHMMNEILLGNNNNL